MLLAHSIEYILSNSIKTVCETMRCCGQRETRKRICSLIAFEVRPVIREISSTYTSFSSAKAKQWSTAISVKFEPSSTKLTLHTQNAWKKYPYWNLVGIPVKFFQKAIGTETVSSVCVSIKKHQNYMQRDFWNEPMKIISNVKVCVYTLSESYKILQNVCTKCGNILEKNTSLLNVFKFLCWKFEKYRGIISSPIFSMYCGFQTVVFKFFRCNFTTWQT